MKRSRIRRVNPERRRSAFARCFLSDEFVAWTKAQPCAVCGTPAGSARWPIECAHARSRGAGGTWVDVLAMCKTCHSALHAHGIRTFELCMNVSLVKLAEAHVDRWNRREEPWAA